MESKEKKDIYFIQNNCALCGACGGVCPEKCIDISRYPAKIDQDRCTRCGVCFNVCPVGALTRK